MPVRAALSGSRTALFTTKPEPQPTNRDGQFEHSAAIGCGNQKREYTGPKGTYSHRSLTTRAVEDPNGTLVVKSPVRAVEQPPTAIKAGIVRGSSLGPQVVDGALANHQQPGGGPLSAGSPTKRQPGRSPAIAGGSESSGAPGKQNGEEDEEHATDNTQGGMPDRRGSFRRGGSGDVRGSAPVGGMALDFVTTTRACPGWDRPCGVTIPARRAMCYFCTKSQALQWDTHKSRPELVADIIGRVPLCICGGDPFEKEHLLTEGHIRYTEGVNPRHRRGR